MLIKKIQQINFKGNLARARNENTTIFFIIEEANKTILDFLQGIVTVFKFTLHIIFDDPGPI